MSLLLRPFRRGQTRIPAVELLPVKRLFAFVPFLRTFSIKPATLREFERTASDRRFEVSAMVERKFEFTASALPEIKAHSRVFELSASGRTLETIAQSRRLDMNAKARVLELIAKRREFEATAV